VLTTGADAEDFEVMTVDGEVGVAGEIAQEVVDRAPGKGDDGTALGADEVVAVARLADDVGGVATGLEEAGQQIDRGEDLQRPIDGRAPDRREFFDELFGGERPPVGEDGFDDGTARHGQAVTVIVEHAQDMLRGWELWRAGNGRSVHDGEA
jgi:hypothetical protein